MESERETNLNSLIFYHGWGFDSLFWKPWLHDLSRKSGFHFVDRGYFGSPTPEPEGFQVSSPFLVCHSLGLHGIHRSLFEQAQGLMIFGGFSVFHPENPSPERSLSVRRLEMMIRRLQTPERATQVLREFYQNCLSPHPLESSLLTKSGDPNWSLLKRDLQFLNHHQLDLEPLRKIPRVLIFHGTEDKIVSHRAGELLAKEIPNAKFFQIDGAGHLLPITHQKRCLSILRDELRIEVNAPCFGASTPARA